METDRLRWFLAVAKRGAVRRAAGDLGVSAGAVSKAIAELEAQLGHRLFDRSQRGLLLTEAGAFLREHAGALLRVEETIREGFPHGDKSRRLVLFGSEPLVAIHFDRVLTLARERFPECVVDVRLTSDDRNARSALAETSAALALVTEVAHGEPSLALGSLPFGAFVGTAHPLARRTTVPVADVIETLFVVPEHDVFGSRGAGAGADGWREDVFPRRHRIGASAQIVVQTYVESGYAVAYLPLPLGQRMKAHRLEITGCSHSFVCEAFLLRSPDAPGWLRQII